MQRISNNRPFAKGTSQCEQCSVVFELLSVESEVRYGCMRHSDLERRRHVPNLAGGFQWSESFDLNL
jgi:hypothetical protein